MNKIEQEINKIENIDEIVDDLNSIYYANASKKTLQELMYTGIFTSLEELFEAFKDEYRLTLLEDSIEELAVQDFKENYGEKAYDTLSHARYIDDERIAEYFKLDNDQYIETSEGVYFLDNMTQEETKRKKPYKLAIEENNFNGDFKLFVIDCFKSELNLNNTLAEEVAKRYANLIRFEITFEDEGFNEDGYKEKYW